MEQPASPRAMELRNEFAGVRVELDHEANGARLKVTDLETGLTTFLDPFALQALTWLSPEATERIVVDALR